MTVGLKQYCSLLKPSLLPALIVATFALLLSTWSGAAVLGEVTVMTYAGQPLHAEVEIYDIAENELGNLRAGLASSRAFADAESEITPLMRDLKITLHQEYKRVFVHIDSLKPINEPIIGMVLELKVGNKSKFREYAMIPEDSNLTPRVAEQPVPHSAAAKNLTQSSAVTLPASPPNSSSAKTSTQPANIVQPVAATETSTKISASELGKATTSVQTTNDNRSILLPETVFTQVEETSGPRISATLSPAPTMEQAEASIIRQTRERPLVTNETIGRILPKEIRATRETIPDTKIDLRRAIKPQSIKPEYTKPDGLNEQKETTNKEPATFTVTDMQDDSKLLLSAHEASRDIKLEVRKVSAPRTKISSEITKNRSISGKVKPIEPEPVIQRQDRLKLSSVSQPDIKEHSTLTQAASVDEDMIAAKKSVQESNERILALEKNIAEMKLMLENSSTQPIVAALPYGSVNADGITRLVTNELSSLNTNSTMQNHRSDTTTTASANNDIFSTSIKSNVRTHDKIEHPGAWGILQLTLASLICGVIAFTILMRANHNG